jgi:uncharacterized membrane protein
VKSGIRARARVQWWRLSSSLWFVPAILVALAIAAALGLVAVDEVVDSSLAERWPAVFGVGAEGARSLLSAIATAALTVAGTMFSVTLAVLSLAASQYSPRVLRTFMSDRPTQVVLGFFVALFAYCLVVLRTIRGGDPGFVPSLAALGGIVLALIAIGLLVYFIHHLAASIEAATILERLTGGTARSIDSLFPDELGEGVADSVAVGPTGPWTSVASRESGYVVSVDSDGLLAAARRAGRVVRMDRAIGDFVVEGEPLASLEGTARVDGAPADELRACFSLDRQRTVEQDAAFGVQQIADIARKALSPGINDQSTAILCIDRLSELMVRVARRRIVSRERRDGGGALRVLAVGPTFESRLEEAFRDICDDGATRPAVNAAMLRALERIRAATRDPQRLAALERFERRLGHTSCH